MSKFETQSADRSGDGRPRWHTPVGVVAAAAAMAASASGFALFFYDVIAVPDADWVLMVLAWALMVVALVVALWASDHPSYTPAEKDFAVGALRTTLALPIVILCLAVVWMFLFALMGGD